MPAVDVDIPDDEAPPMPRSKGLAVHFYKRVVRDEAATKDDGVIRHKSVDYIKIAIPGDKTLGFDRPVEQKDIRAHAERYKAYREERSQDEADGTPLRSWAGMTLELAEDFIANAGVRTVEQLAEVADGNLATLGPLGRQYQNKAKEWLKVTTGQAPVAKLQHENEELRAQLEAAQRNHADLVARLESADAMPAPKRKK